MIPKLFLILKINNRRSMVMYQLEFSELNNDNSDSDKHGLTLGGTLIHGQNEFFLNLFFLLYL